MLCSALSDNQCYARQSLMAVGTTPRIYSALSSGLVDKAHYTMITVISTIVEGCNYLLLPLQARVQLAALQVQKQLAERARDEAAATVAELEAQLEEIGAEIADHMQVSVQGYVGPLLLGAHELISHELSHEQHHCWTHSPTAICLFVLDVCLLL